MKLLVAGRLLPLWPCWDVALMSSLAEHFGQTLAHSPGTLPCFSSSQSHPNTSQPYCIQTGAPCSTTTGSTASSICSVTSKAFTVCQMCHHGSVPGYTNLPPLLSAYYVPTNSAVISAATFLPHLNPRFRGVITGSNKNTVVKE